MYFGGEVFSKSPQMEAVENNSRVLGEEWDFKS